MTPRPTSAAIGLLLAAAGCASIGEPVGSPGGDGGGRVDAGPIEPPGDGGPAADAPSGCTGGDRQAVDPISGRCYLFFYLVERSWTDSRDQCGTNGATLAIIGGAAENDFVTDLVADNPGFPEVWLGGSDIDIEGTFAWLDGSAFNYTHWAVGEPNANNGAGEDCLAMRTDNLGFWNDEVCTGGLASVCEK